MKKTIVVITDCFDIAYSEIRATIFKHSNDEVNIEPVVAVKPFSIINGNFALRLMAEAYPPGTIFSVILNPMQVRPERLIGRTKKGDILFMGANTGVFTWLFRDFGISELYEYTDPGFISFGGKFVHAPAVAKIAMGAKLSDLGATFPHENILNLDIKEGTIVHVDNMGLMKFTGILNANDGDIFKVSVNKRVFEAVYAERMMSKPDGTWVIYHGSSLGLPELGKVRQNGAELLNVKEGDQITYEKI